VNLWSDVSSARGDYAENDRIRSVFILFYRYSEFNFLKLFLLSSFFFNALLICVFSSFYILNAACKSFLSSVVTTVNFSPHPT
jgi:hypothetical protein